MNMKSFLGYVALSAMLVQIAGCKLPEFRATPFVAQKEKSDPDRVNMWPLVFAQHDVMSACFNLYSHSDEHVALHPLFSLYRDDPGNSFTSFNMLCGLYHWDMTGRGVTWLPPYWSWRNSRSHMLFPLWLKNRSGFYSWLYAETTNMRSIPLLLSCYWKDDSSWFSLPILTYYNGHTDVLFTPLYFSTPTTTAVPLLLSGYTDYGVSSTFWSLPTLTFCNSKPSGTDVNVLLGLLYHQESKDTGDKKSLSMWSLPLLSGGGYYETDEVRNSGWMSWPLLSYGKYEDRKDGSHDYVDIDLLGTYYHRDTVDVGKHGKGRSYRRHSILWKFWDWREEDGDVSLDCFPGVTYNSGKDGSMSFSFLWRFYRYARDANGDKKLDILFIPFMRP